MQQSEPLSGMIRANRPDDSLESIRANRVANRLCHLPLKTRREPREAPFERTFQSAPKEWRRLSGPFRVFSEQFPDKNSTITRIRRIYHWGQNYYIPFLFEGGGELFSVIVTGSFTA